MVSMGVMTDFHHRLEGWEVLVLGGTGLIGSHVVRSFASRGARVRVLVRRSSRRDVLLGVPGVVFHEGNLFDLPSLRQALDGCQILVHAAAPYPTRAFGRRGQMRRARESVLNVVDAARFYASRENSRTPVDPIAPPGKLIRIVYVSAPTTIAPATEEKHLANEERSYSKPPDGAPYFRVKEFMEREFMMTSLLEDLPVVIVNPTFVVDAYDPRPTSGQLLLAIAKRELPFLLKGHLNVVAGRDVGEGILLAAMKGEPGERYILGGENMTLKNLVQRIARISGVRAPRTTLPMGLAEGIAWITEVLALLKPGSRPLFPVNGLHLLKRSRWMDSSRAKRELGWRTTSVDEAIKRALEWFQKTGMLRA
jgi:dihydroflavonol-4-reductase